MKFNSILAAGAVLFCLATTGRAAGYGGGSKMMAAADADLASKLQGYETKVNQAFKDKDSATFNTYVDANGLGTDATGFTPVSQMGAMMKDIDISSFSIEDYKVMSISKDVCVATYVWKGAGSYQGQPMPPVTYCSTVWAKEGKDWKAVYHQESAAMPMTPPPGGTH